MGACEPEGSITERKNQMEFTSEIPVRNYESVIILNPEMSEDDQKKFFKNRKETVESFEGQVNHVDTWGKRKLANPIKKYNTGNYFHSTFTAKPDAILELERKMNIDDGVLRYQHIVLDSRISIDKHLEAYKGTLLEAKKMYDERQAKFQARKLNQTKKFRKPAGPRSRD